MAITGNPDKGDGRLLRPADLLSRHFPTAHHVEFVCIWKGLEDLHLQEFDGCVSRRRVSCAGIYRTEGQWEVDDLLSEWPLVVSELACKGGVDVWIRGLRSQSYTEYGE